MKILVSPSSYTFNASAKTITFSAQIPANQGAILHVTNVTRGVLYYQPQAGAAFTGTWASPTLTLAASTTGHNNADALEVFIDDGVQPATKAAQDTGNASLSSIDGKLPALSAGRVPVDIGASVEVSNDAGNPLPISDAGGSISVDDGGGSLTVDGTVGISGTVPVSGPLTDTQLRATAVPVSGTIGVNNFPATQPVSAASLPLPTGAATSANQSTANASLSSIDGKLTDVATQTTLAALLARVPTSLTVTSTRLLVDGSGVTQPVSGTVSVTGVATETTLSALNTKIPSNLTVSSTRLLVDGSGVTQPISAASLPLPSGAATAAKQPALGTAGSPSSDVITVQGAAAGTPLPARGLSYEFNSTFTRPGNQTPYTAGDAIGDTGGSAIIQLTNIGPTAGWIMVQSVGLMIYSGTLPTNMTFTRLHLYSASPTAIADNAAWDLVSGDRTSYITFIDLPTPIDMGSTLYTFNDYPGKLIKLAAASTSLWGILQVGGSSTVTFAENSTVIGLRMTTVEYGR